MKLSSYIRANKRYYLPNIFSIGIYLFADMIIPVSGQIIFVGFSPFYLLFFVMAVLKVKKDKIPFKQSVLVIIILPLIVSILCTLIVGTISLFLNETSIQELYLNGLYK